MSDRLELKAQITTEASGQITGIAWPYGTADRVGDVVEKGAFAFPTRLPILWAHDPAEAIGIWEQITDTPEGLTVKGRLLIEDVAKAREVHALIRAGAVTGLSVGFVTKAATPRPRGRTISAAELHEVSVVAIPCNPGAQITAIKAATPATIEHHGDIAPMENEALNPRQEAAPVANAPQIDLKAFDVLRARLDALEAKAARPGVAAPAIVAGDAERKAFTRFLQTGELDTKALTVANDAPRFVLAPEDVSSEFVRNLVEWSPVRSIADVRSTTSHTVQIPKRTGITNAKWKGETAAREASEPTFDEQEIAIKEINTYVDLSQWMLEDSANVEAEVRLALAEDFGQKEGLAFVKGGAAPEEPKGFLTAPGIAELKNGHATTLSPDALIRMAYSLPGAYRSRATWVMSGATLGLIRGMKDAQGQYLWQPSYQAGQPETILGRPVVELVDMPAVADAATPIVFGDFKAGFRIYDRVSLDVRVDPYTQATNGLVRFHARRRVGSDVVRPDAFRKLVMAA